MEKIDKNLSNNFKISFKFNFFHDNNCIERDFLWDNFLKDIHTHLEIRLNQIMFDYGPVFKKYLDTHKHSILFSKIIDNEIKYFIFPLNLNYKKNKDLLKLDFYAAGMKLANNINKKLDELWEDDE